MDEIKKTKQIRDNMKHYPILNNSITSLNMNINNYLNAST